MNEPRFLVGAGLLLALLAWGGEATGMLSAWAVLLGAGIAVAGPPPVLPRGVGVLGGAVAAALLAWSAGPLPQDVALVRVLPILGVLGLALGLTLRGRWPAWPALVGGGAVLAADPGSVVEQAPGVVAGMAAGVLPVLLRETWTARTAASHRSPTPEGEDA